MTLHGNGGYLPILGKNLTKIKAYDSDTYMSDGFLNDDLLMVGIDDNPECTNIKNDSTPSVGEGSDTPTELYICWSE